MVHFKLNQQVNSPNDRLRAGRDSAKARSPRRRVVVNGNFHSLTGTYRISIRNLSCTGALIECPQSLTVGKEGVLGAEWIDQFCRIVWNDGNLYGLQFDTPLAMDVVLEVHRITGDDVKRAESLAAEQWWKNQAV